MISTLAVTLAATEDAGSIVGLVLCVPGVIAAAYVLLLRSGGGQG